MKKIISIIMVFVCFFGLTACSVNNGNIDGPNPYENIQTETPILNDYSFENTSNEISKYIDKNGDVAYIPALFRVSDKEDEQEVRTGLVVIGNDENEYVWIPIDKTTFSRNNYGSSGFYDETGTEEYKNMYISAKTYSGFYLARYEASKGENNLPQSKKSDSSNIWVHIPPQDMIKVCKNLYVENKSVTCFLPYGINWDTTLQWLVDSGCKTQNQISSDSSSWGIYYNNTFADYKGYCATGAYEQTKANNIYDLAGNYWEWTQERSSGGGYAARAGGYTIMGGPCNGNNYPVSFRSGLPRQ